MSSAEGGGTYRDHLEGTLARAKTAERRAEIEAELEGPHLPNGLVYLWQIFQRLHTRRSGTGFGPASITWMEIDAFQRVTGTRLAPWEVEAIEAVDDVFMAEALK